jgi:hypothetical protein
MGFEAPGEEQGARGLWDRSLEGYDLPAEGFDTDQGGDQRENPFFYEWEWGGHSMELEIPQERAPIPIREPSPSTVPSSDPAHNGTSPSTSPEIESIEGPASSASHGTPSAGEWLCDFSSCGKRFSHRHKLKYVFLLSLVSLYLPANRTKSPQEVSSKALSLP